MALQTEWSGLTSSGNRASISDVSQFERHSIRARKKNLDGQPSIWVYEKRCVGGDIEPPSQPKNVIARGFGGQIGVTFTIPPEDDYDRSLIYISRDKDELRTDNLLNIQPVGDTVDGNWTSGIKYTEDIVYYVVVRSLDVSGNLSVPSDIVQLIPGGLARSGSKIIFQLEIEENRYNWPPGTLWISHSDNEVKIFRRQGLPNDERPESWIDLAPADPPISRMRVSTATVSKLAGRLPARASASR